MCTYTPSNLSGIFHPVAVSFDCSPDRSLGRERSYAPKSRNLRKKRVHTSIVAPMVLFVMAPPDLMRSFSPDPRNMKID